MANEALIDSSGDLNALFWLETAMVEAFAISWIIKGETLLADPRDA